MPRNKWCLSLFDLIKFSIIIICWIQQLSATSCVTNPDFPPTGPQRYFLELTLRDTTTSEVIQGAKIEIGDNRGKYTLSNCTDEKGVTSFLLGKYAWGEIPSYFIVKIEKDKYKARKLRLYVEDFIPVQSIEERQKITGGFELRRNIITIGMEGD